MAENTLYERLGGYDAISAVASNLLTRLMSDAKLARFWENRGTDGLERETAPYRFSVLKRRGAALLYGQ